MTKRIKGKPSTRVVCNGVVKTRVRASHRADAHWRTLPTKKEKAGVGVLRKVKNTIGHALPHRVRRFITGIAHYGLSHNSVVPERMKQHLRKNAKRLIFHSKGGKHVNVVGSRNDVRFGKKK